nr:GAF domain-containing sensor histidine kinase [Bacillota bacterium]
MPGEEGKPTLPRCWEVKQCGATECPLYENPGVACWLVDNTFCEGKNRPFENRFLMTCSRCPVYLEVRKRADGRRIADKAILATFDRMLNNLYSYHISIKETNRVLGQKIARLRSVQEISEAILGPYKLEQVLYMVLTALTAGEGFGFNRAFLFLVNNTGEFLTGKMAVGPCDHEEAMRIWGRFSKEKRPLKELMRTWDKTRLESKINKTVNLISFPLNSQDNVLVQSLMENRIINVPDVSSDKRAWPVAEGLKTDAFAVLPLVKDQRRIGVVVVDNFVTRVPIADEDLESIAPFTSFAAIAIHTAALNDQLRSQLKDLDKAHKRLRSQRQIIARSQQLAQMGRLSADLAHEIRNPMTLIGGFARLLVQKLPATGELHDKAQIIADEVSRLEQLLNDALKMTRDETPRYEPENINFIIMETLNLIASECEEKSIRVVKNLADDLPLMLLDRQKLKEVLINLLQNAIQSMPDGGTITVSSVHQDGNVQIAISDTGIGIKESEKEFIFNPFYTSSPGGTGLGLPLANRIVEAMSGNISMESKVGQGSTFRVTLPIRKAETEKVTPLANLPREA